MFQGDTGVVIGALTQEASRMMSRHFGIHDSLAKSIFNIGCWHIELSCLSQCSSVFARRPSNVVGWTSICCQDGRKAASMTTWLRAFCIAPWMRMGSTSWWSTTRAPGFVHRQNFEWCRGIHCHGERCGTLEACHGGVASIGHTSFGPFVASGCQVAFRLSLLP